MVTSSVRSPKGLKLGSYKNVITKHPPLDRQSSAMKGIDSLRRLSASIPADSKVTVPLRLLLRPRSPLEVSSDTCLTWPLGLCVRRSGTQSSVSSITSLGTSRAVTNRHSSSASCLECNWANVNMRSYFRPVFFTSDAGSGTPRHDLMGYAKRALILAVLLLVDDPWVNRSFRLLCPAASPKRRHPGICEAFELEPGEDLSLYTA